MLARMPGRESTSVMSRSKPTVSDIHRACHRPELQCRHDTNTCSVPVRVAAATSRRSGSAAARSASEWGSLEATVDGGARGGGIRRRRPARSPSRWPTSTRSARPGGATDVPELDRVLGGGLVAGSVTLVGGEPGMGKSTLVLQALGAMAADGARCLLVCAEESAAQVRLRADRLGTLAPDLLVVCETSLPDVCAHAEAMRPDVIAIDSIQAVQDPDAPGGPGSVSQVRDGALRAQRLAKELGIATLLVGHVTKDGSLAGPRTLEHVVDTVLSFEGDRHHALRMLRALKHRFGPTDELGLMEMTGDGLVPGLRSERVVPRRSAGRRVGLGGRGGARRHAARCASRCRRSSCRRRRRCRVASRSRSTAAGSRCSSRSCSSAPASRWPGNDIFASVAGGVKVAEPGADLAVALAIASAPRRRPGRAPTRS